MSQQVQFYFSIYNIFAYLFNIVYNSSDLDVIIKANAIYMASVYAMTVGWALTALGGSVPLLQSWQTSPPTLILHILTVYAQIEVIVIIKLGNVYVILAILV